MIRRSLVAAVIALPFAFFVAGPAAGHRGHDSISIVTIEPDGRILVRHRLEASDLEPALAIIEPGAQPSLDDPEAIAAIIAYLGNRFRLAGDAGPIKLVAANSQLGGSVLQFDFVGRTKLPLRHLTVTSQILTDIHPSQVNQVDVRIGKTVKTLTFLRGGSQTVTTT